MGQRCSRRIITRVSAFLLLIVGGAIVNVAVAWGIVLKHGSLEDSFGSLVKVMWTSRRPLADDESRWYSTHELLASSPSMTAVARTASVRGTPTAADERAAGWFQTIYIEEYHGSGGQSTSIRMPNGRVVQGVTGGVTTFTTLHRIECGWPLRSMSLTGWGAMRPGPKIESGWRLPNLFGRVTQSRSHVVPVKPSMPGFAINTLFYAGILWLLFAAPFALRRRRRIKRDLCPACAYPVGDSPVCTECGKAVRRKEMAA
jgi:hypothetical protein